MALLAIFALLASCSSSINAAPFSEVQCKFNEATYMKGIFWTIRSEYDACIKSQGAEKIRFWDLYQLSSEEQLAKGQQMCSMSNACRDFIEGPLKETFKDDCMRRGANPLAVYSNLHAGCEKAEEPEEAEEPTAGKCKFTEALYACDWSPFALPIRRAYTACLKSQGEDSIKLFDLYKLAADEQVAWGQKMCSNGDQCRDFIEGPLKETFVHDCIKGSGNPLSTYTNLHTGCEATEEPEVTEEPTDEPEAPCTPVPSPCTPVPSPCTPVPPPCEPVLPPCEESSEESKDEPTYPATPKPDGAKKDPTPAAGTPQNKNSAASSSLSIIAVFVCMILL